jgi:hypothetical protein
LASTSGDGNRIGFLEIDFSISGVAFDETYAVPVVVDEVRVLVRLHVPVHERGRHVQVLSTLDEHVALEVGDDALLGQHPLDPGLLVLRERDVVSPSPSRSHGAVPFTSPRETPVPVTAWRCGLMSISACLHRSIWAGSFVLPDRPRYLSALPMQSRSRFRKMIWPLYFGARLHTSASS